LGRGDAARHVATSPGSYAWMLFNVPKNRGFEQADQDSHSRFELYRQNS